jgi:hypothetical protein
VGIAGRAESSKMNRLSEMCLASEKAIDTKVLRITKTFFDELHTIEIKQRNHFFHLMAYVLKVGNSHFF